MNIDSLRREIEAIGPHADGQSQDGEAALKDLFRVFRAAEASLVAYHEASCGAADDMRADWVIEMQSLIMQNAAATRAETMTGVLYKLAMWRWDAPDLEDADDVQRSDRLALSAFHDLARLLKEEDVLTLRKAEDARRDAAPLSAPVLRVARG